MCRDCYGVDDDLDDCGYDERDDDWPGDRDDLDDDPVGQYWPDGPGPWDYRPSRQERFRRVLRTLLPRRRVVIGREQYSDEPPF